MPVKKNVKKPKQIKTRKNKKDKRINEKQNERR